MKSLPYLAFVGILLAIPSAAQAAAPAGRYVIGNGSNGYPLGVVYDVQTQLGWQAAMASDDDAGTDTLSWLDAVNACSALGGTWRLPRLNELMTLLDFTSPLSGDPMIDPTAFPATPAGYFWTSTIVPSSLSKSYFVDFSSGTASYEGQSGTMYVRCVQ